MAKVRVYYDQLGNTLTVWFGDPEDEFGAEETGDEVILMKDQRGKVIGFEKPDFVMTRPESVHWAFETGSPEPVVDYRQAQKSSRTRQVALRESGPSVETDEQ